MDRRVNFPTPEMYPEWRGWATQLGEMFSRLLGQTPDDQVPYVCLKDRKDLGTDGGTFTSGAWRTRDLNLICRDSINMVRLSANTFRLPRGRYVCNASAPAFDVGAHQTRLYNVTDSAAVERMRGTTEYASGVQTRSCISSYFELTSEKVLRLEHICQTTKATTGFGRAGSLDLELYSMVELWGIL